MKTSKRVSNKDLSSFQFGEYVLTSDNHFPDKHEPEPRLYVAEVTSPIDEELEYFLEMTKTDNYETDVNCTSTHSKLPTDIPNDFELIEKYFKETAKDERPKSVSRSYIFQHQQLPSFLIFNHFSSGEGT